MKYSWFRAYVLLLLLMAISMAVMAAQNNAQPGRSDLLAQVLIAFISTVPATIAALAALIVGIKNQGKQIEMVEKQTRMGDKVEEVHKATNSMKDALVAAALIEGETKGVEKEKVRRRLKEADIAEGHAEAVKEAAVAPAVLAPAAPAAPVPVVIVSPSPVPVDLVSPKAPGEKTGP